MSDDIQQNNEENVEPSEIIENDQGACPHCEEYKSGWQRAVADYHNLQKETERMRASWASMSETQILNEFLPVYDNFKKAFAATHEDNGWTKGIGFIKKQMKDVLTAHGIEEIPTTGQPFQATLHEAVGEEEAEGVPVEQVIREVEGGYRKNGQVLKVAKVVIAK